MADETRDELRLRLREEHFNTDVPKSFSDRVFAKAWEDGHSCGIHEVEMIYDELAGIVDDAFTAGVYHGYS